MQISLYNQQRSQILNDNLDHIENELRNGSLKQESEQYLRYNSTKSIRLEDFRDEFRRMSEIETMLGGKISPGLQNDLKTDLEIHKLNTEFKQVNFG
jgi:hypothetical protein